ncbi:hypothetical protein RFI_18821, partial [Reticulomyxa filosa]
KKKKKKKKKKKDEGIKNPGLCNPQLPSPYLPNSEGSAVDIPTHSYYRSHSTIITTTPDGQTKKITTTTDSSGRTETVEEVFDANNAPPSHNGGIFSRLLPWHDDTIFRDRTNNAPHRDEIVSEKPRRFNKFWNWFRSTNTGDSSAQDTPHSFKCVWQLQYQEQRMKFLVTFFLDENLNKANEGKKKLT